MVNKKILIIDDETDFGFLMKSFFSSRHHVVFIAQTLAEGMRTLEDEKPDYIFLDNHLPDGCGWGKTEFILDNYPHVHLNLISAMDVPKTSASSFRILFKPTMHDELTKIFG